LQNLAPVHLPSSTFSGQFCSLIKLADIVNMIDIVDIDADIDDIDTKSPRPILMARF